jgi:D-alanyl-D-alanine dipeptidase
MAIDLTSKITPQLVKAMKKAGWVQFDAGKEPWHFSYKEPH